MPKLHDLKTDPIVFDAVARGEKKHEIRFNDRAFKVGDILRLHRTKYSADQMRQGFPLVYTGHIEQRTISHIQAGYGLLPGFVVLSFENKIEATNDAA